MLTSGQAAAILSVAIKRKESQAIGLSPPDPARQMPDPGLGESALSQWAIAADTGRSQSAVSRELARNSGQRGYRHGLAVARRRAASTGLQADDAGALEGGGGVSQASVEAVANLGPAGRRGVGESERDMDIPAHKGGPGGGLSISCTCNLFSFMHTAWYANRTLTFPDRYGRSGGAACVDGGRSRSPSTSGSPNETGSSRAGPPPSPPSTALCTGPRSWK